MSQAFRPMSCRFEKLRRFLLSQPRLLHSELNLTQTWELITAHGHMMPPPRPLHVCNGLASPVDARCGVYCEICEVIRYVAAPVWRRFEFLSYPAPWFRPKCRPKLNQFVRWWQWMITSANFIEIRSVFVWSERNTDVSRGNRDNGTVKT